MKASGKVLNLVGANGSPIPHYGHKQVRIEPEGLGKIMGTKFEVAEVRKP